MHKVLSVLEQPQVPEFVQGSSGSHGLGVDLGVDQLTQQLQESASFKEDPDSIWLGESNDNKDIFTF